jgi:hypothetical protein
MESALAVLNPAVLEQLDRLSKELAQSNLIPDALKGKPRDVLVTLMTGAELGLGPMQALRSIAVVKGKPALSADLMVSLVKQRKDVCEYLSLTESTDTVATYKAKRVGEPEPTIMSFTMQDAQKAGLNGSGGMYSKYPKAMLRARAASSICRAVFPDLCMGLYDSDSGELTDGKPTEMKDVTPAPRGGDAVRAALAKPAAIGAIEAIAIEAKEEPKPPEPSLDFASLSMDELAEKSIEMEAFLQKNPKSKKAPEGHLKLAAIQAEIDRRRFELEGATT